jgi:hypothetical protein
MAATIERIGQSVNENAASSSAMSGSSSAAALEGVRKVSR